MNEKYKKQLRKEYRGEHEQRFQEYFLEFCINDEDVNYQLFQIEESFHKGYPEEVPNFIKGVKLKGIRGKCNIYAYTTMYESLTTGIAFIFVIERLDGKKIHRIDCVSLD